MTQRAACKKIGISEQTMSTYTNGQIPKATILHKIAQVTGKSMEWFLSGGESPGPGVAREEREHYHALVRIVESDASLRYIVEELNRDSRLKEVLHTLIRGRKQGAHTTRLLITSAEASGELMAEFEEWPGPIPGGEGGDDAKKR